MSSLIFIDDERVTVLEGIVKCPVNLALGLRDQDLTPTQIETLASKKNRARDTKADMVCKKHIDCTRKRAVQ